MSAGPRYPVLALGPDRYTGDSSAERFYHFRDAAALAQASHDEQKCGSRAKWDIVDNEWNTFRIVIERPLRPVTPLWQRTLMTLFAQRGAIVDLLEIEFREQGAEPPERIRARVWASICSNQHEWSDESALEQGREPRPLTEILSAAKAAVDEARSVADLFERLSAAWPA